LGESTNASTAATESWLQNRVSSVSATAPPPLSSAASPTLCPLRLDWWVARVPLITKVSLRRRGESTRWSTTRLSNGNLSHAFNLCGANLVTYPADFRGVETLELHRVERGGWLDRSRFTEMCSGSKAGSYLNLRDFCITQLWS
jgi:hypothetical protein